MKNLLTSFLSLTILSLTSTTALAHSGHLSNQAIHSFLHSEHIIMLLVIALVFYVVKLSCDK